jgi:hypothetical protein
VTKSHEVGASLNIGVRMNQNYSPRKPSAIQIASVTPFIGEFALGPLLSGLSLHIRAGLGFWRRQAPETEIFHLQKFVDSMA